MPLEQDDLGLFLLVTHQHKDNPQLFFVVPTTILDAGVGTYDVPVHNIGTAYTGRGLWLHQEDFQNSWPCCRDPLAAERARQQLARMVHGEPGLHPDARFDENLYWDHLDQIEAQLSKF